MSTVRDASISQADESAPPLNNSLNNNSNANRRMSNFSHSIKVNQQFHDNNAADNRKMRRVIAEDLDWNLMTIPTLSDLCTRSIVKHFATHPIHDELPDRIRKKVLAQIPVDSVPLKLGSALIDDNGYWERCCKAKWRVNDVSKYGHNWKRMYFERELQSIVENFVPNRTDMSKFSEIVTLGARHIVKLDIRQLLPPVELEKREFNLDEEEDDEKEEDYYYSTANNQNDKTKSEPKRPVFACDHFDFSYLMPWLVNLQELHLSYCVRDCGMNFEWQLFDFTKRDCQVLAKCVAECRTLKSLHINRSRIDDDKIRLFISQVLDHPSLVELDLSHNLISDRGCRAIGKLVNGHSRIETLNLCNNMIRAQGAQAIAHALVKNQQIKSLDLRLNRLADEGGQAIAKSLLKNSSLIRLNLASNNMSEPTAALIAGVIVQNKALRYLDLSSNRLGPDGGKQIQEAMQENKTLIELDLRLTEAGQDSEFIINQILKRNYQIYRDNN